MKNEKYRRQNSCLNLRLPRELLLRLFQESTFQDESAQTIIIHVLIDYFKKIDGELNENSKNN